MQATKAIVKKVKTVIEKTQFIKVKHVANTQNNRRRTLAKKREKTNTKKKRKSNEMPNTNTVQVDEICAQPSDLEFVLFFKFFSIFV